MILAVASTKGGTGKSTITLNLAGELARTNHHVLVVDADPQGSISRWDKIRLQDEPDIMVHPSPVIDKKVQKKQKKYDLVLFDAPPTFKRRMKAVIEVSDRLIIPVTPGMADFWSTGMLIDMYLAEKERRPSFDARLLINRVDRRTRQGREFRNILKQLSIPIFLTEIPQRVVFGETWTQGKTVDRIDPGGTAARDIGNLSREVLRWIAKSWTDG